MSENSFREIIANEPLALSVRASVEAGINQPHVHLSGSTFDDVVQAALCAARRDINEHRHGRMFQRFIEHGPHGVEEEVESSVSLGKELPDADCGTCIELIHSHMVNRFKGELAEMLAIGPCIMLVRDLQGRHELPADVELYFGDTIQERRCVRGEWADFAKGADGLIVCISDGLGESTLELYGVIEVKSMYRSKRKLDAQINSHIDRLSGGVKLGPDKWRADRIVNQIGIRVSILPAGWKLDRDFEFEGTEAGRRMVFPEPSAPEASTQVEEVSPGRWTITLAWSQEALEEAAYEMTFWYMGQVGNHVFARSGLPQSWSEMTTDHAGRNSLKMMLYHTMLRPLSDRHARLAAKLYNIYCFGYPIGIDSREMLWPEDME